MLSQHTHRNWCEGGKSRFLRRPFAAIAVAAAATVGAGSWTEAGVAAPPPPPVSQSYYVQLYNQTTAGLDRRLYRIGKTAGASGIPRQVVVLAFGAPRPAVANPTVFSQQVFGFKAPQLTLMRIRVALECFSRGYHDGWQTPRAGSITIAWGTSNGKIPSIWSNAVAAQHGLKFAEAVKAHRDWTKGTDPASGRCTSGLNPSKTSYNKQTVVGAMDIEQDVKSGNWNDWPITKAWVDGYISYGPARAPFLNFGSNEVSTCTAVTPLCQPVVGQWTTGRLVELSRGSGGRSFVCPQIYNTRVITHPQNGGGWTFTQRYANENGKPLLFYCVLTTTPDVQELVPAEAWARFYDEMSDVQGVNYATNYVKRRLTNIKYQGR